MTKHTGPPAQALIFIDFFSAESSSNAGIDQGGSGPSARGGGNRIRDQS